MIAQHPALLFFIYLSLLLFAHADLAARRLSHTACDSHMKFSCSQIRQMPLTLYLGGGLHKASYLTSYRNHTYVLRIASHPEEHAKVKVSQYKDLEYKRRRFSHEWLKLMNHSLCHPQRLSLYGICNVSDVVADLVEPIITFDAIDSLYRHTERPQSSQWWCWPFKWIIDILEELNFAEVSGSHPMLIELGYYYYFNEFGISMHTATLKNPDFAQFNVHITGPWVDVCCEKSHHHCPSCHRVEGWRISDCKKKKITNSEEPIAQMCDNLSRLGHSRATQRFMYETIVRHMLTKLDVMGLGLHSLNETKAEGRLNVPYAYIDKLLHAFLRLVQPGNFLSFPSPSTFLSQIQPLWNQGGTECIAHTTQSLIAAIERQRAHYRNPNQHRMGATSFLKSIIGKSLEERLRLYPYTNKTK